jgi:predicted metal-binding membrane protein
MTAMSIERLIQRDRVFLLGGLAAAVALSWLYLLHSAGMETETMGDMVMPSPVLPWSPAYVALMLAMWAIMMVAMMLPSAAPMFLLYASLARRREGSQGRASMWAFVLGYGAVWLGFSLAAVGLQWALDAAALFSPMMQMTSVALAGVVLIGAGLYQWTPLKQACLRQCRSPLDFVLTHWRPGVWGAFRMGGRHGAYCLGCCWVLMLLLFVGGVMNVAWITGIAAVVLVEKMAPAGHWISRATGAALVIWGAAALWPVILGLH